MYPYNCILLHQEEEYSHARNGLDGWSSYIHDIQDPALFLRSWSILEVQYKIKGHHAQLSFQQDGKIEPAIKKPEIIKYLFENTLTVTDCHQGLCQSLNCRIFISSATHHYPLSPYLF